MIWSEVLGIARRLPTAPLRGLPQFIIIGTQKAGTTALYSYLSEHPAVLPAMKKEVHYFDNHFERPLMWYRLYFPFRWQLKAPNITGEASPYYLFHPHTPQRVYQTLPNVKLIALLRNPVDRTYSQFHHETRAKRETRSFEAAIDAELERMQTEDVNGLVGQRGQNFTHRYHSYLARSRYAEQVARWLEYFPREQLLILRTEDLRADTQGIYEQIINFLGLPQWTPAEYPIIFQGSYDPIPPAIRARLSEYFAPYNAQLAEIAGRDFEWD